jgi:hypothetical protein
VWYNVCACERERVPVLVKAFPVLSELRGWQTTHLLWLSPIDVRQAWVGGRLIGFHYQHLGEDSVSALPPPRPQRTLVEQGAAYRCIFHTGTTATERKKENFIFFEAWINPKKPQPLQRQWGGFTDRWPTGPVPQTLEAALFVSI